MIGMMPNNKERVTAFISEDLCECCKRKTMIAGIMISLIAITIVGMAIVIIIATITAILTNIKTVSYTHLDVYKRQSYYRWNEMAIKTIMQRNFNPITRVLQNSSSACAVDGEGFTCSSVSGYEIFMMEKPSPSFIWEGLLTVDGQGKFGLVCDLDPNGNGYFISFNPENGVVRIRSWGFNADNTRQNFIFNDIQSALFDAHSIPNVYFRLIRYGNYIEFSIDGEVKLSLMDYTFSGNGIGFYTASELSLIHI